MGPSWQQIQKEERKRKALINYTVAELSEIKIYLKQIQKMLKDCEIKTIDFQIEVNYYLPEKYMKK